MIYFRTLEILEKYNLDDIDRVEIEKELEEINKALSLQEFRIKGTDKYNEALQLELLKTYRKLYDR